MLRDTRYTGLGFFASAAIILKAIAAMTGPAAIAAKHRFDREVRPRFRSVGDRRTRGPNGLSFRSLKRAVNAGWTPPQPTRKAMARHAWFKKKLDAACLRIAMGQELRGDRALLREV